MLLWLLVPEEEEEEGAEEQREGDQESGRFVRLRRQLVHQGNLKEIPSVLSERLIEALISTKPSIDGGTEADLLDGGEEELVSEGGPGVEEMRQLPHRRSARSLRVPRLPRSTYLQWSYLCLLQCV